VWTLQPSLRWAIWFNAWLAGQTSLDDARDAVVGSDAAHDVLGLDDSGPTPLIIAWGRLRSQGATAARAALVTPGDPAGLAGPPVFNEAAVDAGEAVLIEGAGVGLVPEVVGRGVFWHCHMAAPPPSGSDVPDAERALRLALARAAVDLADLDVARWRPELAAGLAGLRAKTLPVLAPGYPVRAEQLATLALRCLRIGDLATQAPSGAGTSYELDVRHHALLELTAAARHALASAASTGPHREPPS